ncbi:hypothetical protein [Cytobacillus oceanisediminis]|uniref:hypothetical protein n=1 Tax=Cytobacillus oceanisediminis TaxID=665099 RepID=UPI001C239EEA|nr:hypothetical protein [Cytobacillus oceanisediminis]MBU8772153.1 hypothetical protein [Cytobacillus oceanisediminis]
MSELEVKPTPAPKKRKGRIFLFILLALVLAGGTFTWYSIQEYKKGEAAKTAAKAEADYKLALELATIQYIGLAASAEGMSNTYTDVWHTAIFDDSVTINDKKYYDFNSALEAQRQAFNKSGELKVIEDQTTELEKTIKGMANPPEKYKEVYQLLVDGYPIVKRFADQASSPSGSYDSYSDEIAELDAEVLKHYDKLKIYLPE